MLWELAGIFHADRKLEIWEFEAEKTICCWLPHLNVRELYDYIYG